MVTFRERTWAASVLSMEILPTYLGRGRVSFVDSFYSASLHCRFLHHSRTRFSHMRNSLTLCGKMRLRRSCWSDFQRLQKKIFRKRTPTPTEAALSRTWDIIRLGMYSSAI